jgi:hypothetical protein
MEEHLQHLLAKYGILASFSIARKMNEKGIQELTNKIKPSCKNKHDFNQKLKIEIQKQSIQDILNNKIPGLINNSPDIPKNEKFPKTNDKGQKRFEYKTDKVKLAILYSLVSKINTDISNNNLTKNDVCFMIYAILNFLEITEEDFKRFHSKLKSDNRGPDENDSDFDDGYDEDNRE